MRKGNKYKYESYRAACPEVELYFVQVRDPIFKPFETVLYIETDALIGENAPWE